MIRVHFGNDLILIYKKIENCIGEICKFLIPIKQEYYKGNGSKIAICTLSSIKLSTEISNDTRLMNNVVIVGRLLSENKGIDNIIKYCIANKELGHLVLCGKDGYGHRDGDSIMHYRRMESQENVKSSNQKALVLIWFRPSRMWRLLEVVLLFITYSRRWI
jgi:tetrahydromethanopterin S-methyltransferase subunit A